MASLVLSGDTSGSITVSAPAVSGSTTQTLVNVTGTLAPIVSGTAVASTSGTSIDFTSIPSWVKRITVMFQGVSTSGTSDPQIQLGTSSGVATTGYLGSSTSIAGTSAASSNYTTGIALRAGGASPAASVRHGGVTISNVTGNTWMGFGIVGYSDSATTVNTGASITLGGTLDRVRITTVNGTDTFDAGTINILYE